MNAIKFSKEYPKLWKQEEAILMAVRVLDAEMINENKALLEYDTKADDGSYYELPKEGKMLQLVFIGNKDIPFCTIRRHTFGKEHYYQNLIGHTLKIERTFTNTNVQVK